MEIKAKAWVDRLGACNYNIKGAETDRVVVDWAGSLVEEVSIRAQNFWDFLQKSNLISWVNVYKSKFLLILYIAISISVHDISSSSNNASCENLTVIYLCCFYTYTPYFCRQTQSLHWY